MPRAKTPTPKPKAPRAQHPRLVGFSEEENALVERAARAVDMATNPYIRESALFQAREDLGLMQPEGEK